MSEKELIEYFEHIRLQVACYKHDHKSCLPLYSGSGFMLYIDGRVMFITAGHVATTHEGTTYIDDKLLCIQTNSCLKDSKTNQYGCLLVPIDSITSISALYVDIKTGITKRVGMVDVSFAELKGNNINAPYVTQSILLNDAIVKYGESKQYITCDDIVAVNKDDIYSVFGRVKLNFKIEKGQYILDSEIIFHTGLKYIEDIGDISILRYDKSIVMSDWKGLSGSPVLNQNGKLIGVATSVDPIANTLHIMRMERIIPMIKADIMTSI